MGVGMTMVIGGIAVIMLNFASINQSPLLTILSILGHHTFHTTLSCTKCTPLINRARDNSGSCGGNDFITTISRVIIITMLVMMFLVRMVPTRIRPTIITSPPPPPLLITIINTMI